MAFPRDPESSLDAQESNDSIGFQPVFISALRGADQRLLQLSATGWLNSEETTTRSSRRSLDEVHHQKLVGT
jgi:hypothetical protein